MIEFNFLLIPIVLAFVQIIKQFFPNYEIGTKERSFWDGMTFIFSILSGIALSFLVDDFQLKRTVLEGILIGLSASGLYTGGKAGGGIIKTSLK